MEGSASIGATQSAVMRSSRFRSSRATLSSTTGSAPWVLEFAQFVLATTI